MTTVSMLMCIFPNSKSIGHRRVHAAVSRGMNGRNDQEEQWDRTRSVVSCDVINLLATVIHNGRPRRDGVLPRLEILARSFAIYLSLLFLFLPNLPPYLPLFCFQIPIQFAHQRKLTNTLHESIDMELCQRFLSFSFSLCLLTSRCYPHPPTAARCPQVTSYLGGESR